jgi:hypothetical protein
VVEAIDEFTMAALGAGWRRWLIAAASAVKQYRDIPFHAIGVEAEPTHFKWMLEHFRDNGLDPVDHNLMEADRRWHPKMSNSLGACLGELGRTHESRR